MSATLALRDLQVVIQPTAIAAEACRDLFETLGARVRLHDSPDLAAEIGPRDIDIVISSRPPAVTDPYASAVWVVVTESGCTGDFPARAAERDATLGFGPIAESLTAAHATLVALAALRRARHTGQAITAEVGMIEVMATCVADLLIEELCPRTPRPRLPTTSRMSVVPCADGSVTISASSPSDRADLAAMTGLDALLDEDEPIAPWLASWAGALTREEIVATGQAWRLPILPVLTGDETRHTEPGLAESPFRVRSGAIDASEAPTARWRSPSPSAPTGPVLGDVRILDLGMVWAGPYCGRLLAGLGAEVMKVEGPRRRDGPRPADDWTGCSGFFADLNRGKSSLVLDLSTNEGRALFLDMTRAADIVVDNFSPRVMPNFGLDFPTLAAGNRGLIQLSMPAFDSAGPQSDYVSYGSGLELACGLGIPRPDGGIESAPVPYLDVLAGAYGAIAVVAALLTRDRSGAGMHTEVAQYSVARNLLARCPADLWVGRAPRVDPPVLAHDPDLVSSGFFTMSSADGHCCHLARPPWHLRGIDAPEESPAPAYGADTSRILRELTGATSADIERWIQAGVVVAAQEKPGVLVT